MHCCFEEIQKHCRYGANHQHSMRSHNYSFQNNVFFYVLSTIVTLLSQSTCNAAVYLIKDAQYLVHQRCLHDARAEPNLVKKAFQMDKYMQTIISQQFLHIRFAR